MRKSHKLQLPFLNSLQICRPKDALVTSPLPLLTHFSTTNSETHEILFPSFQEPPPPHPSTTTTPLMTSRKDGKEKPFSPFSSDSSQRHHLVAQPTRAGAVGAPNGEVHHFLKIEEKREPKAKVNTTSISTADHNNGRRRSFHGSNSRLISHSEDESKKPERRQSVRTRRFKRFGSKEWKDGSVTEGEHELPLERKTGSRGLAASGQSFIVVKQSANPCEDFKKSMIEMIVEKQMFEPKELEQLLMSFLSLNSRMHHKAILKAFTEIWKEVFSGSPN